MNTLSSTLPIKEQNFNNAPNDIIVNKQQKTSNSGEVKDSQNNQHQYKLNRPQQEQQLDVNLSTRTNNNFNNKHAPESQVKAINFELQTWNTNIQFKIDKNTESLVISVVDKDTGKEIKQIPSEVTLRISKMISDFQGSNINTQI